MNESILTSIKLLLGINEEDTSFDGAIVVHINTVLSILHQIGVGTSSFSITGSTETWDDYLDDAVDLEAVKTYIYLKVKTIFDPSASSVITEAINRTLSELEFRIQVVTDVTEEESS